MDVKKMPFAGFMEEAISMMVKSKPEVIVFAARRPDGAVLTGKWQADPTDVAACAAQLFADAMLDMVVNNIELIRDALDDLEEDEDG